jgi:PhzF family phenazine biosynthesis protein
MSLRQWTVDAFASAPFEGNPACVVEPLEAWPDDDWMQALAMENNQAETAFLLRTSDPARFGLRWFTPAIEVPLCGHATLASAHALFEELKVDAPFLTFDTASGALIVRRTPEGYEMDFPADPPQPTPAPLGLVEALGETPSEVWVGGYLVALFDHEQTIIDLKPDLAALASIAGEASRGPGNLIVAAPAEDDPDCDVVVRFFAPGSGIPEDPATGSAYCLLAPLFAATTGETRLRYFQAYPGRGADIEAELMGDRVLLRGSAITTVESVLRV